MQTMKVEDVSILLGVLFFSADNANSFYQAPVNMRQLNGYRRGTSLQAAIDDNIADYLGKKRNPRELVLAIPCDSCHELQIELESVQRAVLYHCPIAVHACLGGSMLQLPLLKIQCDVSSSEAVEASMKTILDEMDEGGLRVQFEKLEIEAGDISENEILYAAINDEDTRVLKNLAETLSEKIQVDTSLSCTIPENFRVPFMQLPSDWNRLIHDAKNSTDHEVLLSSDEGGNGVSPLFWIQWCDDKFGSPQRLREIGLFESSSSKLPFSLLSFPGCEAMSATERHWEEYQETRFKRAEDSITSGEGNNQDTDYDLSEDALFLKTRERLDQLYSAEFPSASDESVEPESKQDWSDIQDDLLESPQRENDPESVDEWTRKRIQAIVEAKRSRTRLSVQPKKRKDLPPLEENEIIAKLRERLSSERQAEVKKDDRELPPFPSREHCIGIWEMLSSPTGFEVETGDPTRSDNLILRVDGAIAGGPILDQETRQKACGGCWTVDGHNLHVELIIPPERERALVMKGEMEQPRKLSFPIARNTFGVPELEERFNSAQSDDEEVYCNGKVWLEDVGTKANRREIGTFAMRKLERSKEGYIINVPRNVRPQD